MNRAPQTKIKNWTGTVHFAAAGVPACGPVKTHDSYLRATVEAVTCERCIARFGADTTPADLRDELVVEEHVARRAAERAARQAARNL